MPHPIATRGSYSCCKYPGVFTHAHKHLHVHSHFRGKHLGGDPGSGKLQYCWRFLQQQELEGHARGFANQTGAKTFIQGQEALTGLEIPGVSETYLLA